MEKNKNISYINNSFSEYIGSNIFKICGFSTQNTILGKYSYNSKDKIVCACEDFTDENTILYEFENLALSTNLDKKVETDINDIIEILNESKVLINLDKIKEKFWDMFIIDAFIGNTDRHNGNWGLILNKNDKSITFSPIYDCGSCLNPLLDDADLQTLSENEIKNLAINCYSCLKEENKRINYMSYIKDMKNIYVNKALIRVFNNIEIDKINDFIDNIKIISEMRKEFYKKLINIRYNILKEVYNKLVFFKERID